MAVLTDGSKAELELAMKHEVLADLLSNRCTMTDAFESGLVTVTGDQDRVGRVLNCFEVRSLSR